MKKLLTFVVVIFAVAIGLAIFSSQHSPKPSGLLALNIEALAHGHSSGDWWLPEWWDSKTHSCVPEPCIIYDPFWQHYSMGTREVCQSGASYAHCWDCNLECRQ